MSVSQSQKTVEQTIREAVEVKKPETPTTPTPTPRPSPEQEKLNQLMRELVVEATRLVFKVATCDCNHKDSCELYQVAKRIAKLVDEISSLRPSLRQVTS